MYKWLVVEVWQFSVIQVSTVIHNTYALIDTDVQPPFTEQPGPKVPPSCETLKDCFSLFFDDNLLQYIVNETNTHAQKKLAAMQVEIIHVVHELDALHVKIYLTECCRYHGIGNPSPTMR